MSFPSTPSLLRRLQSPFIVVLLMTIFSQASSSNISRRRVSSTPFITSPSRVITHPSSYPLLTRIRGGDSDDDDESSDDEYDSDLEDDELLDDFDLMEDGAGEDDFSEESSFDRILVHYQKTPPLTKAYLTASAVATGIGFLFNNKEFPSILTLSWNEVLTRGQIWRPFTTFLNFGAIGLGYALTLQFVWMYMGTLERLHHRKPYDFWIMIMFGMLSMVIGYPILKVNPRFLGHNLSTFLVYVWSRYHEGMDVNLFELFNTRAELLPWFFLLQVRFQ